VLDNVDAQCAFDIDETAACAYGICVIWPEGFRQFLSGNQGFHILQQLFLAGLFPVLSKACIRRKLVASDSTLGAQGIVGNNNWN
jgi:hypothetical protein